MARRVLLAVDASTNDLTPDDRVLADALIRRGVEPVALQWGADVPEEATVVIRSTWDYVERPDAFAAWLDRLDTRRAIVHNATTVLRWNAHKRYLLDLARSGVPIVPTELVPRGSTTVLADLLERTGWQEVAIKPAVGGTARLTEHSGRIGIASAGDHLARLLEVEDAIVQPLVASVPVDGEVSVVAVDGDPLAAFVKRAAPGEWRVQSDFGGSVDAIPLTAELVEFARAVLDAAPSTTYARVDVVRLDGRWALMELELVEPELFFRFDERIAERLAHALATPA